MQLRKISKYNHLAVLCPSLNWLPQCPHLPHRLRRYQYNRARQGVDRQACAPERTGRMCPAVRPVLPISSTELVCRRAGIDFAGFEDGGGVEILGIHHFRDALQRGDQHAGLPVLQFAELAQKA